MPAKKYPWDQWFARPRTVLRRGVDYTKSQSSMYQMIRNAASNRKLRVCIYDTQDGIIIELSRIHLKQLQQVEEEEVENDEVQHTDPPSIARK